MAENYSPNKDEKLQKALAAVEDILKDSFLPRDLQVQRLATVRDFAKRKVLDLKAS